MWDITCEKCFLQWDPWASSLQTFDLLNVQKRPKRPYAVLWSAPKLWTPSSFCMAGFLSTISTSYQYKLNASSPLFSVHFQFSLLAQKKRGTRKKGGLWSVWLLIAYLNSIWFSGHTHRVSTTSLVLPAWFHVFRNGLSGSEVYHSSFRFLSVFRTLSQNCTFIPFELRRLRTLHINWHGMSPI